MSVTFLEALENLLGRGYCLYKIKDEYEICHPEYDDTITKAKDLERLVFEAYYYDNNKAKI